MNKDETLKNRRWDAIQQTIRYMKGNRSDIRRILTEISTYKTAEDEIDTSIRVLENAYNEVQLNNPLPQNSMSVFMPSNVLLYSYILYLLIPSLYVEKINFRSATQVKEQLTSLHTLLKEIHQLPIQLQDVSHRKYIREFVMDSDVVIFTGKYQNAEDIKFQLNKDQVYLYFGQGVNPFIITESAPIEKSVDDLIMSRLYNSGQDCMGPDAIFVKDNVCDEFLKVLMGKIKQLQFGDNMDPQADYGKIYYESTLDTVGNYLNVNSEYIIHGGSIDFRYKKLQPTVLLSSIEDKLKIIEFFSPIFNIIIYKNDNELMNTFQSGYFIERAMGASIYGYNHQDLVESLKKKHIVSENQALFDIEDGNKPFGGYGAMANYISYQNNLLIKPILLSKTLNELHITGGKG